MKEQRPEPEEDRARGEAQSRTQARPPRTAPACLDLAPSLFLRAF